MSFFKKVMASVGIGAARVDLIPDRQEYRLGEEMQGKLVIYSGDLDQTVDMIYLHLKMDTKQGDERIVRNVASVKITDGFTIQANSPRREFTFTYRLPYNIPVSSNRLRYTLSVGMDIKNALDPRDVEPVRILPSLEMEAVLGALNRMGFVHKYDSGEIDYGAQKFEFYPTNFMRGKLDDLEVTFSQNTNTLNLYLEIDRKARGLSGLFMEALELDERHTRLAIPASELVNGGRPDTERAAQLLKAFIQQEYDKIV